MSDLHKCKLCGGELIDCHGMPFHTHATNCPLIGIRMTPDQWIALMGEDMDAVRRIKAQAIREAAEHVERTHRHIPSTRFNHGALDAVQRMKEYARQLESVQ